MLKKFGSFVLELSLYVFDKLQYMTVWLTNMVYVHNSVGLCGFFVFKMCCFSKLYQEYTTLSIVLIISWQ